MPLMQSMSSRIELQPAQSITVLDVDCAYSGRVAVAYAPQSAADGVLFELEQESKTTNLLCISVYECESSGK